MAGRFVVKGVNDEQNFCCCCGRDNLKRVVWIEDTETGAISHFGTTCAEAPAKAFGVTSEIRAAVRKFQATAKKAAKEAEKAAARAKFEAEWDLRNAALEEARRTYTGEMIVEYLFGDALPARPAKMTDWLRHLANVQERHGL
jgi:hypothetical protein